MNVPTLATLSTIDVDGSRRFLHPADVKGPLTRWRRLVAVVLLIVYVVLPWITINGGPAVFLDVQERRFHFFGLTLATQDLWVAFFLITGVAFGLFYVTALFGRIWCGWACPYTVFLEHVYRRVERWVDGDAPARRQLDAAVWGWKKAARRGLKHGSYLAISAVIAHIFLSYFVPLKKLYEMMQGPPREHLLAFGMVAFLTVALYFAFSWFREQFCIILCPYGRLQSALIDEHSVVIGYDSRRGEPRGKARASAGAVGDCVDCRRCVQVCPTGIDIRNGLQLECIGCAACVDACNDIMTKLHRPQGLVRYDSQVGLQGGKTRYLRARIWFYTVLLCAGMGAFATAAMSITPLRASAVRMVGAPFYLDHHEVRNQFLIRVINKRNEAVICRTELIGALPPGLRSTGLDQEMHLAPFAEEQKTLVLTLPEATYDRPFPVQIKVINTRRGDASMTRVMEFLGPDPRLKNDVPLNPKDFIR
ncbi:MAG: cytochrome c oxidase accessory protein CcoG [Prosthecobacter sp.]|nr:cytochrome c oxidase accessory protein CcoG [Prosthecobacter sp.]